MKILSAAQIRELDKHTINHEPISSINLMERASLAFCSWFTGKFSNEQSILIFAGTGNNGGDGLAIARILRKEGYHIEVCLLGDPALGSEDFKSNLHHLPKDIRAAEFVAKEDFRFDAKDIIIDAIFGSGLNRSVEGIHAKAVDLINQSGGIKIAVDVPSGLFCDKLNATNDKIVRANYTLTFELPKLCFLLPENEKYVGDWSVAEIGLSQEFIEKADSAFDFIIDEDVEAKVKKRSRFSHKGTFGHALILAGSYGKMGASVLCARACLKTGVGLLTMQVPKSGYQIMQVAVPEAMCIADDEDNFLGSLPEIKLYETIGIGPGIGKAPNTKALLEKLITTCEKPLVIDADGLNLLAENKHLLQKIPPQSILTPHPKEFERLAGKTENSIESLNLLREFSIKFNCITVLKGAYTATCSSEGKICFNSTGNPGMATGGSGDVLTGIITGLLAQKYKPLDAALIGVYLHGYAGDCAANQLGFESLTASDITENINCFFRKFNPPFTRLTSPKQHP